MNEAQAHCYIYKGVRYNNMKDCIDAIGNGEMKSRAFKHMLRYGIVKKILINKDVQIDAKNLKRDETIKKV